MESTIGYVTPSGSSNADRISVLDNRGKVSTLTSGRNSTNTGTSLPALFTDEVAGTSLSVQYAAKKLESKARESFPFSARIQSTCTPGVLPGGLVEVSEFNSDFDGLWYVTDICQTVTRDRQQTDISAIKDTTLGQVKGTSVPRKTKIPSPVLSGGVWKSTLQTEITYA
jgi:hypothetical protein